MQYFPASDIIAIDGTYNKNTMYNVKLMTDLLRFSSEKEN